MTKTCYEIQLDYEIIEKIVEEDYRTNFNKLVISLKRSKTTISKHLKVLERNKIINWVISRPGHKGLIELTQNSKMLRKYGYLIAAIDYSDVRGLCREDKFQTEVNSSQKRKKKAILFLLISMAYGYIGYKVKKSKTQPGDVLITDVNTNPITAAITDEAGFSPIDLHRKDFQLSMIQNYLSLDKFREDDVQEIINEIQKNDDVKLVQVIGQHGETRYDLQDDALKRLLIYCHEILKDLLNFEREYWYILSKKPKRQEYEWFRFIVGDNMANMFFQKIEENRAIKKTVKQLYIETNFRDSLDPESIDAIIKRKERSHPNMFTKKGMKEKILRSIYVDNIRHFCRMIQVDKDIQRMISENPEEGKYQFLLKDLNEIINPRFSKSIYDVKLYTSST